MQVELILCGELPAVMRASGVDHIKGITMKDKRTIRIGAVVTKSSIP